MEDVGRRSDRLDERDSTSGDSQDLEGLKSEDGI
jgi:hypothetical protein